MHARRPCRPELAAALWVAALAACAAPADPQVGPRAGASATAPAAELALLSATVTPLNRVVVTFRALRGGAPVASVAEVEALAPAWTLAGLAAEPVTGARAWRSYLLTGDEAVAQLPIAGPGTPPALVATAVRQPGVDAGGALAAVPASAPGASPVVEEGTFTYTFGAALPAGFSAAETLRVGAWLEGVAGSARTSATLDLVPAGGTPERRELVTDAACAGCHGTLSHHDRRRTGTKLCVTCHTWQSADADTVDPAAPAGATPATNPNPLELARLVHRIHRGKQLPTLYQASSAAAAPDPQTATSLPTPFFPGRNPGVVGRKFSVVGAQGRERVFGRIAARTDNFQPARIVPSGVTFPRELRDCEACHGSAADAQAVLGAQLSRRTCGGCHTDVWFVDAIPPDAFHLAHPGGPQADDGQCATCHLPGGATPYAPIADIHVPPRKSPRHDTLGVQIVAVEGFAPGAHPTVAFTIGDRNGALTRLDAPVPAADGGATPSPVPRAIGTYPGYIDVTVAGPTAPDYRFLAQPGGAPVTPVTELIPLTLLPDASGTYRFTMSWTVPAGAAGTWAVGMEARRAVTVPHYDGATHTFRWPYTGEQVIESARNPVVYVDVAAGGAPGGSPTPRRQVVDREKCDACHQDLRLHGGLRSEIEFCVGCHAPEATDWIRRRTAGNVALGATYDGIEERSVHLKVLVHRIHTGAREGPASLAAIEPFVVYGYGNVPYFFDEGGFPGDLADCTVCHVGKTYEMEAVPAGAGATLANESPTVRHGGTIAHVDGEPTTPPIQAACLGCHANGHAEFHAAEHTTAAGVEQCLSCHGARGAYAVSKVHGIADP